MAPVTRNKKSKASSDAPAKPAPKDKVATTTTKRKAVDDASPVTIKKTKAVKETQVKQPAISKTGLLPTKKAKESKPTKPSKGQKDKTEAAVEEDSEPPVADDDHPFSDDEDEEAKALAETVDSDDEDPAADAGKGDLFKSGQDVGKAPKPTEASKQASSTSKGESGVLYIGRVPHGFYEYEMRQYFSQFGKILRLRLSRSKRTGASKHFAFLEFEDAAVAEVAQKTMDNYLLFGHILKCKLVPKSQIHDSLWKGANKRFKKIPRSKMQGNDLKKPVTESGWTKRIEREAERRNSKAQKLLDMGYEFEGPQLKDATDVAKETAALEANDEAPKAVDALLAGIAAAEEAASGDLAVKDPAGSSKQDGPKSTSKKTKKASKAKKAKA
ncbi:nucleolar protein [Diatrype stigma]|uniref:Nucleolar protein n=1 Tax=Diatrype stigma TaxID=117547 RepID=A0AAN9V0U2_9PEZI